MWPNSCASELLSPLFSITAKLRNADAAPVAQSGGYEYPLAFTPLSVAGKNARKRALSPNCVAAPRKRLRSSAVGAPQVFGARRSVLPPSQPVVCAFVAVASTPCTTRTLHW